MFRCRMVFAVVCTLFIGSLSSIQINCIQCGFGSFIEDEYRFPNCTLDASRKIVFPSTGPCPLQSSKNLMYILKERAKCHGIHADVFGYENDNLTSRADARCLSMDYNISGQIVRASGCASKHLNTCLLLDGMGWMFNAKDFKENCPKVTIKETSNAFEKGSNRFELFVSVLLLLFFS